MKFTTLLGCVFLLLSSLSLAGEDRGWYAGAGVGLTNIDDKDLSESSGISGTIFGGYRFNKYFALQGNIIDFGEYDGKDSIYDSMEVSGVSFTAVGILPVTENGFDLFGRLGLGRLNITQNFTVFDGTVENTSSGDAIVSSLGVNYTHPSFKRITSHFALENYYYETTSFSGDNDSHSLSVLTVGSRFNF